MAQPRLPVQGARGHHLRDGDDQLLHLRKPLFPLRDDAIGPLVTPGQPDAKPCAHERCCCGEGGADDYLDHGHTLPGAYDMPGDAEGLPGRARPRHV